MSSPDSAEPDAPADLVPPGPDGPDPDLRAARRTLALFVLAVGATVAGFVLVSTGNVGDDGGTTVAGDAPASPGSGAVRIGPTDGVDVDRYIADRRAVLERVEGRQVAVVSLTGYSSPDTVDDLAEGLEVDRYLVAVVGGGPRQTEPGEDAVDDVVAAAVDRAEEQLAELEELAPTVEDDPDYSRFYEREIDRYRRLIASAGDDDVVHALVVTGTAAELRALASRASVRLVDVGDTDRIDDDTRAVGLRPEETDTTGSPKFRP
jgi:hypothetical protein